jgi:hypothetical protein
MPEIIDLTQEIYAGMPDVQIDVHVSHEQWDRISDSDVVSPAANRLVLGEHTSVFRVYPKRYPKIHCER